MEIIVIGAGPAGIAAAVKATEKGNVILLEKNNRIGKKLLITGKGRCNLTNAGTIDEIISAFGRNGKFLHSALHNFSNIDLIFFLNKEDLL